MFGEIFNFIINLEEFLLKVNLGNFFYVKYPFYVFCDFLIYFFWIEHSIGRTWIFYTKDKVFIGSWKANIKATNKTIPSNQNLLKKDYIAWIDS